MATTTTVPSKIRRAPVETTTELVTAEKAVTWLEKNAKNRRVAGDIVEGYARDMVQGKWRDLSNDAICFDWNGNLINGQHRLEACIIAAASEPRFGGFRSVVIRNLDPNAQDTMDIQRARKLGDVLHLRGYAYQTNLSAAISALVNIAHAGDGFRSYRPTRQELIAVITRHPKLIDSVVYTHGGSATTSIPPGVPRALVAAMHYIGAHILKKREEADAFVGVLRSGVPSFKQDPAHALREMTVKHVARSTRRLPKDQFFNVIHAWNLFVRKEKRIKWLSPRDVVAVEGLKPGQI